ncbi:MAG TPA: gamma-glutamyltransferase [Pseudonocardiaceae bacterium]|nr:gamma-glutamyltransferase [Pseudonocardiaceae bacterium]
MRSEWLHAKTPVRVRHGLVTARHPLAAEAGAEVLRQGGNALDAAAAAILATGVVQPFATTIGGGGVLTAVRPDGRAYTLDYRSEAPAAATPGMYGATSAAPGLLGWSGVPGGANEIGHHAVAVPGTLPGLATAHQALGRLPWARVLAPAIALAEGGRETDWFDTLMQGTYLELLLRFPATTQTFLRDGRYPHRPPTTGPGDLFRQPRLAATLRECAEGGLGAYLNGAAGSALAEEMSAHGGLITTEDLVHYQPRSSTPHAITYRDHTVLGPAHGGLYGLLFAVFHQLDLAQHDPLSPARLHLVAEAIRRCRRIEDLHAGDRRPALWIDHSGLAGEVAASIDFRRRDDGWLKAWWTQGPAFSAPGQEQTAHVCVVDSERMMVSLTETIVDAYGSKVTTPAGMLLNNAMFAFVPVPGYPNSIAPGHRPHSNMSPLVVVDQVGRPVLAAGASGGQRISAAVAQVVAYILDHGRDPQDAVAMPRLDVIAGTVLLDDRFPQDTAAELERRGHHIERVEESLSTLHFANPAAVMCSDDGSLRAGVSPLHLTAAAGW